MQQVYQKDTLKILTSYYCLPEQGGKSVLNSSLPMVSKKFIKAKAILFETTVIFRSDGIRFAYSQNFALLS